MRNQRNQILADSNSLNPPLKETVQRVAAYTVFKNVNVNRLLLATANL